jgi:hypothetical protein
MGNDDLNAAVFHFLGQLEEGMRWAAVRRRSVGCLEMLERSAAFGEAIAKRRSEAMLGGAA